MLRFEKRHDPGSRSLKSAAGGGALCSGHPGARAPGKCVFAVIVPVCDEEASLGDVLDELAAETADSEVKLIPVVGLNGTSDDSRRVAEARGVLVGETPERGYGHGCMAAINRLAREGIDADAYVFFSGDGADRPADVIAMIEEYGKGADMVIGNRTLKLSNWRYQGSRRAFPNVTLATVTTLLTGKLFFDLGPLRLIDRNLFERMAMRELTWGWTVEAQVMAARLGARIRNIHVSERPRLGGVQKVSGVHWRRSLGIGFAILAAAWRVRWRRI